MCGRARLSSDVSEIKLVFSIPPERPAPNIAPSWNVAPTDPLPIVHYDAKAGTRDLEALVTRQQLESLRSNVRTVIELREAGAFGTGGFGADAPVGSAEAGREHGTAYFSFTTLERVQRIPHADHIAKIEEYVMEPQIDPSVPNAYAMNTHSSVLAVALML